jgi:His/Glu/Gln/Arg/opine family amino acid ABC transporter permease subunit
MELLTTTLANWWTYLTTTMMSGLVVTVATTFVATALTMVWALVPALLRSSRARIVRLPAQVYIEVFRGTPVLIQLFAIYFGLAIAAGILIDAWTATIIALTLNLGGYLAESYRSGIASVPVGHVEAATALGMSRPIVLRRVVGPEAIRIILPAIGNIMMIALLTSPISALIGNQDLLYRALQIQSQRNDWSVYVLVAIVYAALGLLLAGANSALERRLRLPTTAEAPRAIREPRLKAGVS